MNILHIWYIQHVMLGAIVSLKKKFNIDRKDYDAKSVLFNSILYFLLLFNLVLIYLNSFHIYDVDEEKTLNSLKLSKRKEIVHGFHSANERKREKNLEKKNTYEITYLKTISTIRLTSKTRKNQFLHEISNEINAYLRAWLKYAQVALSQELKQTT
uniref:Uncharacterized protein n=1 Tax=Onchocerca volvulus TaxID=6282 RepID=A0A8R1XZK2_ONCVO